jgi:hypothetical protein
MTRAASALLLALAAALLLSAGPASAKDQPSTIYVDKAGGYRITVPRSWQVVPPSLAAVKAKVKQLEKQKKTELAAVYAQYANTAAGRAELQTFRFRAFRWPLIPSPVPTDVSVSIQRTGKSYTDADLPAIASVFRQQLSTPGATVSKPQLLKLPSGNAALLTGTVPLGKEYGGAKTGFSLILMLHRNLLYMLSFRIDSGLAGEAKVFASMAQLFRFT